MDIIARNFFRLLRAGVFDEEVEIEPMSAWKWRRVYQYSIMHELPALLFDGIEKCRDQFFMSIPDNLDSTWKETKEKIASENIAKGAVLPEIYTILNQQQLRPVLINEAREALLYEHPEHRIHQNIAFFFPYQTQGNKADKWARNHCSIINDNDSQVLIYEWKGQTIEHHHRLHTLTNKLLNHTLYNIIEKEFRENEATFINIGETRVEVVSNTLNMLLILLRISQNILSNGISMKHLADLGIFLRKAGDKVDYVKLQEWIERLHMKRIALLTAILLIDLLDFTEDEIPFTTINGKHDERAMKELFNLRTSKNNWHFQQGNDIFVHSTNSSAMMWHVRQSARNFSYYPLESFTNFFASLAHSLSHIEE